MARASVILRFTNRSPQRVKNLMTLIRHISRCPHLEIIVSCMEKNLTYPSDIEKLKTPTKGRALLVHNFSDKPFASTTANNIGASLAKSNIFIFQDADILFDTNIYNIVIRKIERDKFEAIRVGEDCLNLSQPNTTKLFDGYQKPYTIPPLREFIKAKEKMGKKGSRDAPGACTALSRNGFIKIGGWCELFQVYGWEDCYFRFKVNKSLKRTCLEKAMIHLAHEVNYQSGHQPKNAPLYGQIIYAKPEEYESIIQRDRKALFEGYPRFKP